MMVEIEHQRRGQHQHQQADPDLLLVLQGQACAGKAEQQHLWQVAQQASPENRRRAQPGQRHCDIGRQVAADRHQTHHADPQPGVLRQQPADEGDAFAVALAHPLHADIAHAVDRQQGAESGEGRAQQRTRQATHQVTATEGEQLARAAERRIDDAGDHEDWPGNRPMSFEQPVQQVQFGE